MGMWGLASSEYIVTLMKVNSQTRWILGVSGKGTLALKLKKYKCRNLEQQNARTKRPLAFTRCS